MIPLRKRDVPQIIVSRDRQQSCSGRFLGLTLDTSNARTWTPYMGASDFARETLCDGVGTAAALYSAFFAELDSAGPDEIR